MPDHLLHASIFQRKKQKMKSLKVHRNQQDSSSEHRTKQSVENDAQME